MRSMAGLLLKNNIKTRLAAFPPTVVEYVKAHIFTSLGDPVSMIRNTVGTVIDTLLVELGPANWPEALSTLIELVDSTERFVQEVSLFKLGRPREQGIAGSADANGAPIFFCREPLVRSTSSVRTFPRSWRRWILAATDLWTL